MAKEHATTNGHQAETKGQTPYVRAVLGFRNYWYPVCLSKDVTVKKPKALTLLGDMVVFFRRNGKAYALADECAHRGTQLSIGKYEFPGTNTITCRYHGWTYDVTNGMCVAVLCEGPESQVPGKVRIKTYPVEERAGIVWMCKSRGRLVHTVNSCMPDSSRASRNAARHTCSSPSTWPPSCNHFPSFLCRVRRHCPPPGERIHADAVMCPSRHVRCRQSGCASTKRRNAMTTSSSAGFAAR